MIAKIGLSNCYYLGEETDEQKQLVIAAAAELPEGKKLSFVDLQDVIHPPEPDPTPEEKEKNRRERAERFDEKYCRDDGPFDWKRLRFLSGSASIFTAKEYRLIAACLHPTGEISGERKTEAFQLFTDRKDKLVA